MEEQTSDHVVHYVYQWERKGLLGGFSSRSLLQFDAKEFTNLRGEECNAPDNTPPPSGWVWEDGVWEIVVQAGVTDNDGWQYASGVSSKVFKPKDGIGMWVRRRQWSRVRRRKKQSVQSMALLKEKSMVARHIQDGVTTLNLKKLEIVYCCEAERSVEEIASLLNITSEKAIRIDFLTPNQFFSSWKFYWSESNYSDLLIEGGLVVIYKLEDDETVINSILFPILQSGLSKVSKKSTLDVDKLAPRFEKFKIVLAGWKEEGQVRIPDIKGVSNYSVLYEIRRLEAI